MEKDFVSPNDYYDAESDTVAIMRAVYEAENNGCRTVKIPRYNKRTDSYVWNTDSPIELPDDFTLILDNCHIRQGDGSFCNAICNRNCHKNGGEQRNIHIVGVGHPVLDGGKYNGYSEHSEYLPKALYNNSMIMLHNVDGFTIENINITDHRYWAVTLMYCGNGRVRNIDFAADLSTSDDNGGNIPGELPQDYEHVYIQNSDGIDLRLGCYNIIIENITGFTVDDTVALTNLSLRENERDKYFVENKSFDIHDIVIKNICSYTFCWTGQVRLLSKDGQKIYNVTVDTVINTVDKTLPYRGGCSVMIGDSDYIRLSDTEMGDIYNVTVKNIHSRAIRALRLTGPMSYINIEDIFCGKGTLAAINVDKSSHFKNVFVNGIYGGEDCELDSVLNFSADILGEIQIENIACETADYLIRRHDGSNVRLGNYRVENLKEKTETSEEKHYAYWYLDKDYKG